MTDIALDYTSRISPAALKLANVIAVSRYISVPIASTAWKRITKPELDELVGSGIDVTLNFEYDARDWLGGSNVGKAHATIAVSEARKLGYPYGKVIPGSCDFDMTPTEWNQSGIQYARAFRDVVRAGGYRPGVYGPWDVLTWCRDIGYDAFWQAGMSTAWSNGRNANPWPGAHFRQRRHMMVGGTDTDVNDILIRPLWGAKKEMQRIAAVKDANGNTLWYVGDGIWYTRIITWGEHEYLIANGAVEKQFNSGDDWLGWTGRIPARETVAVPGTSIVVTPEELAAAIASNVDKIGAAIASHIKVV